MADIIFEDFTLEVQDAIDDKCNAVLEECAGEVESAAKRNSRVKTGKTKNSFRHKVDTALHEASIGSSDENAIWEEFGTGEYALKGNGRKGGWVYKDATGEYHHTHGKTPSRALYKAFSALKDKIINHIQNSFKGL